LGLLDSGLLILLCFGLLRLLNLMFLGFVRFPFALGGTRDCERLGE
jgi:hypothetical protein